MCANSEGSGETAQMRRLAWAFAGHLYDKYHNLRSWLNLSLQWIIADKHMRLEVRLWIITSQQWSNICICFPCRNVNRNIYHKNPKNSDTWKIAVIILKLEQYNFTTE